VRTCVVLSNRDTDPPIRKLLHAVDVLCIDYYEACQRKGRTSCEYVERLSSADRAVPTASAERRKRKICWDSVHALLELVTWLQAGEDRAIAAGSQADKKTDCPRLTRHPKWVLANCQSNLNNHLGCSLLGVRLCYVLLVLHQISAPPRPALLLFLFSFCLDLSELPQARIQWMEQL
jgi:hypothetical protein